MAAVVIAGGAIALAARARAADDGDWAGRTFEGEPGACRPLDSMPDEAMPEESMPRESRPLHGPVDSRITDSEVDDGPAVAPRPREMILDGGRHHKHHKLHAGELRDAVPVDDGGGVQPAPGAVEPMERGPKY